MNSIFQHLLKSKELYLSLSGCSEELIGRASQAAVKETNREGSKSDCNDRQS